MEYINPVGNKYKIINLLFSCDQINFDLGYILSKNVKEIEVDDIDTYFEHELNKKNYIDINNISHYIREQSQFYERKIRLLYISDEANIFYKRLLGNYEEAFSETTHSWGKTKILFKVKNTLINVIYGSDNDLNTPLFEEYYLEAGERFTCSKEYVEKNKEVQEFLLIINDIDFLIEYYNEKKEEIDELTDKIHFLQKIQELINNHNDDYPDFNNRVKERYFHDQLKNDSFPVIFGDNNSSYEFSVSINSTDNKFKTCNVDIKRWKGSSWHGSLWRRNFKKRNLSSLFEQIKHLIYYD
tara:strand:- start:3811 stop:4704 length:894 start_codon:yes stop_codon:yes gene_type:complete